MMEKYTQRLIFRLIFITGTRCIFWMDTNRFVFVFSAVIVALLVKYIWRHQRETFH